jgi:signal transduction histidine kinase
MIARVVKRLSKLFIEKKVSIDINVDMESIYTDKKSFEFVLMQIIINSLKYVNEYGKIKIEAKKAKNETMLIISDNGIGIKSEDLPRVFDKGFTGFNGRRFEHSTGIGLYLVKCICDRLEHEIRIESVFSEYTKTIIIFRG